MWYFVNYTSLSISLAIIAFGIQIRPLLVEIRGKEKDGDWYIYL